MSFNFMAAITICSDFGREDRDGLTGSQASYVIDLAFSVWSCIGSGGKVKGN